MSAFQGGHNQVSVVVFLLSICDQVFPCILHRPLKNLSATVRLTAAQRVGRDAPYVYICAVCSISQYQITNHLLSQF